MGLSSTPVSKPGTPVLGRGAHITSGCENYLVFHSSWKDRKLLEIKASSWRACTQTCTHRHSLWALMDARDIQEETELCGFEARAAVMATTFPVVSPPSILPVGAFFLVWSTHPNITKCESPLAWWTLLSSPWWLPETQPHPIFPWPKALWVPTNLSPHCSLSLKTLKEFQSSLWSARDTQGEATLYDFRKWVGEMPAIIPVHSPISVWWMDAFFPQPSPNTVKHNSALAWWTLLGPPWRLPDTLPYCKVPQAPNQVASMYPETFAKWPLAQHWWQSEYVSTWWAPVTPLWQILKVLPHPTYVWHETL